MSEQKERATANNKSLETVIEFLESSSGLNYRVIEVGTIRVSQKVDGKQLQLTVNEIVSVIPRVDHNSDPFIQINFHGGKKILLTDQLIGFKPAEIEGTTIESLPKVVATPDLVGLFEAMEDCLSDKTTNFSMLLELRQASMSIIEGAESIGIDLSQERIWLKRLAMRRKPPQAC